MTANLILLIVTTCISVLTLLIVGAIFIFKPKSSLTAGDIVKSFEKEIKRLKEDNEKDAAYEKQYFSDISNMLLGTLRAQNENVLNLLKTNAQNQLENLRTIQARMHELNTTTDLQLNRTIETVDAKLTKMMEENNNKLTEMKQTVDEKLNANLSARLNESFSLITERLDAIYKGFGEIQTLTSGVDELKKVLGNVKTRGTFGEVQLHSLLEQMLANNQYIPNCQIDKTRNERVDFAIKLPGKDDQNILLPIDAKFPIEDYARLVDFAEKNMTDDLNKASKAIETRIKNEAKKIHDKYIQPPLTTDFAIMYIPIEGLFAEILRKPGLAEEIQREYKIMICSPSTIAALLSSLQMGFKTLYIEKRSSEIWELLSSFKFEFSNFLDLLGKTQKKINEASSSLEDATKKTQKIQRQLFKVTSNAPEFLSNEDLSSVASLGFLNDEKETDEKK